MAVSHPSAPAPDVNALARAAGLDKAVEQFMLFKRLDVREDGQVWQNLISWFFWHFYV